MKAADPQHSIAFESGSQEESRREVKLEEALGQLQEDMVKRMNGETGQAK